MSTVQLYPRTELPTQSRESRKSAGAESIKQLTCVHFDWPNVMAYGNTSLRRKRYKGPPTRDANPRVDAQYQSCK